MNPNQFNSNSIKLIRRISLKIFCTFIFTIIIFLYYIFLYPFFYIFKGFQYQLNLEDFIEHSRRFSLPGMVMNRSQVHIPQNQEHFVSDPSKVNIWRHVKYDYDFIYRNQFKLIIYSQQKHQHILGQGSVNLGS